MAKNSYIHPEFTRCTAVRLSKTQNAPLAFKVDRNDLVDATIWQQGAPQAFPQLPPRQLGANEKVILRIESVGQAQLVLAWPGWERDCFTPVFFSFGTYCPLDRTDDTGITPIGRRLYWVPGAAGALPPETSMDITVTGLGEISWSSRGLFTSYTIHAPTATARELHVILLTRPGEAGRITLPACGGQPATELKL